MRLISGCLFVWMFLLFYSQGNTQPYQSPSKSDSTEMLTVGQILIVGNKVTLDRIILREISVHAGDTIVRYRIDNMLKLDKNKLYNLRLFNKVSIKVLELSSKVIDLLIELEERWYTFPIPIFELSDRNFNEWWQNYNHDFSRVNYGLRLYQFNFRGRNETLRFTARFGFSKRFDLYYKIPNLARSQKHGLLFEVDFAEPTNLAFKTEDHILTFLNSRETLRKRFGSGITYSFRKSFYETHSIELNYDQIRISDTIQFLNPNYLKGGLKSQWFTSLTYRFISEHRDVVAYPLKGYQFGLGISKLGLGLGDDVNQLIFAANYAYHKDLKRNFYFSSLSLASYVTPKQQPYSVINGIGYQKRFVRGYEIYVIEGPLYFIQKSTFKKRILHHEFSFEDFPIQQFKHFPISIYFKTYADLGYVQNYPYYEKNSFNNRLSNKLLGGVGFGFDVLTSYDGVLRFEYSFTNQKTSGFFFHIKKEF